MNSMSQESFMHVHQMNESMLFRTSFYHVVISSQDSQSVLPSRQSGAIGITNPICRIENVREKNVAPCTKMSADLLDHPIQVLLEITDPWSRLLPGCSVH